MKVRGLALKTWVCKGKKACESPDDMLDEMFEFESKIPLQHKVITRDWRWYTEYEVWYGHMLYETENVIEI